MRCEHGDCFTCPYSDCISDKAKVKGKPGRKKMDPEVVRQHRLAYQKEYYKNNPDKYKQYYSKRNKEKLKDKPLLKTTWVTDGKTNKRILSINLKEWEEKGWKRGRTVKWTRG